jgi:hypothetical protein
MKRICFLLIILSFFTFCSSVPSLYNAAFDGDLAKVKQLVENGEDINNGVPALIHP